MVVDASSGHGYVEAINEAGGKVETRGPGARAIQAGTDNVSGTTSAINRGTVITRGNAYFDRNSGFARRAEGLRTWSDGSGGTALAVNEAGGTIETHGTGAIGLLSTAEGGALAAITTNHGRVTTRGNAFTHGSGFWPADAVAAWSDSAISRATNEARGVIRTYGTGARGLRASHSSFGGRAEAENRGRITTSGGRAGTFRARGVEAYSEHNTAYAANHAGARITTTGTGAQAMAAATDTGGFDESAVALNRGTISTRGNASHTSTRVYAADGVAAFSGGEASAVAINGYEGEIEIAGSGAKGVLAYTWRGGGAAHARNRGRITTRGRLYTVNRAGTDNDVWLTGSGLVANAGSGDATATNEVGGVIETHGAAAFGIQAWTVGGGTARAINRGRVTTRGPAVPNVPGYAPGTLGAEGVRANSSHADAFVENAPTGRVETRGGRAFALLANIEAEGSRSSAMAEVVNRGQAHTRGFNADAVVAAAEHGGTADNPNQVRATNASGATITTAGNQSNALSSVIAVSGGGLRNAYGTVSARNDGSIAVTGGDGGTGAGGAAANGVVAAFLASGNTRIRHGGDVTLVNTGDVTVGGARATGLYAQTFGRGNATVRVFGGRVRAEHASGRGLWARTGNAGRVDVTIAGGAEIAARSASSIAAQFQGGTTNVRLLDSTLAGRVVFGSGRDMFTIRDARVTGNIDFGAGADSLTVHGDSWLEGTLSGIETFNKRGMGTVVANSAQFSSGGRAVVENGGLAFTGQFNLGANGRVTIHDSARLSAVLANPNAPPRITAGGGLVFEGDKELFVQVAPGISAENWREWLGGFRNPDLNPIADGTPVRGLPGPVALRTAHGTSRVVEVGQIPLRNGATRTAGTNVRSGVRLGVFDPDAPEDFEMLGSSLDGNERRQPSSLSARSGPGLALGGGVSALGAAVSDVFDAELPQFALHETGDNEVSALSSFVGTRVREGGLEYWARSWSGESQVLAGGMEATVRGMALGVNAELGGGFHAGASTAPYGEVSVDGARIGGTRYTLRGSWRGDVFHAAVGYSRGHYRAESVFDNPVAGGGLGGMFDLSQDHAWFGTGLRLAWGGVQATPSLSLLSGMLRHGAYTAVGPVFRAEVPAFSQRYYGWKSELGLSAERWLRGPGSLRWRPTLHFYTQRMHTTGPGLLRVTQRDRAGVLSLESPAWASGMPRTMHGFGASVDAFHSKDWRLQLGVAGARADGEFDHTLLARLQKRF